MKEMNINLKSSEHDYYLKIGGVLDFGIPSRSLSMLIPIKISDTSLRYCTVTFINDNGNILQTATVSYNGSVEYSGADPTSGIDPTGFVFTGWLPEPTNITEDTVCVAQYHDPRLSYVKYLENTMTNYESDTATKLAASSFYYRSNLQTATTSATTIESNVFYHCSGLTVIDLTSPSPVTIRSYAFYASNLTHLIIRSTTMSILERTTAFNETQIASGHGAIYVPANLVTTYKAASNWSTYANQIYPISAYPITN